MDQNIAWLLLLTPLAASVAILLNLYRKPTEAMFASVGSASLCFLIALGVAWGGIREPTPWTWISLPGSGGSSGMEIEIGMIFDSLSKGMLLIVTGVGLLIHIFSIGYMAHDPGRGRFFGGLSIFMFSMTGIVLATNLIEMFFFWEGVGLSSYLLIGFWFAKESAAAAANKAFVCNRLADFGFMIGILTYWIVLGTVSVKPADLAENYHKTDVSLPQVVSILTPGEILKHVGHLEPSIAVRQAGGINNPNPVLLTLMVLGLFAGCVGKSAMFPFHVWLPDAMEGPTPVSALIHAATMVAAGVYMLCRVYPLLLLSTVGMFFIASIGCFTAIFAAVIAVQQNDIKRILAYSTLSQLGYMVMAVGCHGPDAAMFHLTMHAFYKALLFLAAGSVIHALHDEQDIWKMGGLAGKIPLTYWTFLLGMLALIGFPGTSGAFSKDYVLAVAYSYHPVFYWVGVASAFLTAFYMTRLVVVVFLGSARTKEAEHLHESPPVMTIPLVILAVLSVFGGWWFIGIGDFYHNWAINLFSSTDPVPNNGNFIHSPEFNFTLEMGIPFAAFFFGTLSAYHLYRGRATDPLHITVLARKFYIDEFYDNRLVRLQQLTAGCLNWIDRWILDGVIIRGGAYLSVGMGELFRLFQTGSLQAYAFIFTLGGVALIYFTLFTH